jgi:CubicO group peptidase (beta-lactamase class C family)
MNSAIADSVFPGAVVLAGNADSILYKKAFGHYTYDKTSTQVNLKSIFDLASVSKVIGTTSAAMILFDEGMLDLDKAVGYYLPEFSNNGKEKITIRNLLLHNSGLPAFKKYYDEFSTPEEIINDIMKLKPLQEPGTKFIYSDLGMITLQKVIEKISNESMDKFLKERVFTPLQMYNTMYNPPDEFKNRCVPTEIDDFWRMRLLQGEVHDERAFMLNGVAGHAGLFSTAEDLSKILKVYLNEGKYEKGQLFKKNTIDNWTSKQSEQSSRGLGWDTKSQEYSSAGEKFSMNSFGHTGFTGTSVWVDKINKFYVILLSNRVYPTRNNRKIVKFRPILHNALFNAEFPEELLEK